MKPTFEEISEDEWSELPFNPSRILNYSSNNKSKKPYSKTPKPTPPTIESFTYTSTSKNSNSDDGCVEITEALQNENLEDDDFDEAPASNINRGRRFIIEDDEDDWDTSGGAQEVIEVKSDEDKGKNLLGFGEDNEEEFELGFNEIGTYW